MPKPKRKPASPSFTDIKAILDQAIGAWTRHQGRSPDLSGHGPSFKWNTKADLLAAVGHGKQLIQPDVIGNEKASQANLVIDLRNGLPLRMPKGGPFVPEPSIKKIEDWINAGCPD